MRSETLPAVVASLLLALVASLVLTPLCRRIAVRTGFVAHPSARGVHQESTRRSWGAWRSFSRPASGSRPDRGGIGALSKTPNLGFLGGGLLIFVMGIIDDRADLSWFSKLLGQIVAAVLLLASANSAGLFLFSPLGLVLSLVWVVGLTNAMNFLDNMDGICAGISGVAALAFVGLGLPRRPAGHRDSRGCGRRGVVRLSPDELSARADLPRRRREPPARILAREPRVHECAPRRLFARALDSGGRARVSGIRHHVREHHPGRSRPEPHAGGAKTTRATAWPGSRAGPAPRRWPFTESARAWARSRSSCTGWRSPRPPSSR